MSNQSEGQVINDGRVLGYSVIGTPINQQILVFDDSTKSFIFQNKPTLPSPIPLNELAQEGAVDGQVLTWSDTNSQFEPQNP